MSTSSSTRVFRRDLPGGGHVAIDVAASRSLLGRWRFDGCVVVERRAAPARDGIAPVIAHANGKSVEAVMHQLLPCALSNVAIGVAILRRYPVRASEAKAGQRFSVFPMGES
jgi:hypothetical protein